MPRHPRPPSQTWRTFLTNHVGQITAADSHGFVYTLTIPPGAVLQDTKIFMYPVTSMKNLPAGGAVTAGVHLAPEGLQFFLPAKLATQVPAGTDPNQLEPFEYRGDGSELPSLERIRGS